MKINVFDTGLGEKGGHHFDFDRTLMRYLVQAGHEVHLYGFVGMTDEVVADLSPYGSVTRLLRPYHYASLDPPEPYANQLYTFLRKGAILAQDLSGVAEGDLWIWPSMRAYDLHAVALVAPRVPVAGCIHWDPGVETNSIGAMIWRVALLTAASNGVRFTPGSPEPELRHRFAQIVPGGKFLTFPHPYDGPAIAKPKSELKRIGFFGHQRSERGIEILAALSKALIARGHEIVVQDSSGQVKDLDLLGVEVLEFVDDIAAPIAACDLVVLPYAIEQYRMKGSGILGQCMAIGIPVVGPLGTMPGRLIEHYGLGPLFPVLTAQAVFDAIKVAEKRYATFADSAFRVAERFSKYNGGARFAEAFVKLAQPATA